MQTIAVAAHKGGVGKTTTVLNLGCALAERGLRVLLVDLDPQANVTLGCGLAAATPRLEDLLAGDAPLDGQAQPFGAILRQRASASDEKPGRAHAAAVRTADRLWILPTAPIGHGDTLGLIGAQPAIVAAGARHAFRLRDLLATAEDRFDVVLIDTPAVAATFWGNFALLAADWVLTCSKPADYDIQAAGLQARFIDRHILPVNPDLRRLGVLITQADARWHLLEASGIAIADAGLERIPVSIPDDNSQDGVCSAPRTGMPFYLLEPDGRVSMAYRKVAAYVADRINADGSA